MIDNVELFLLISKIEYLHDDIIILIYKYSKSNTYKNRMFSNIRLFNNSPRLFNNLPMYNKKCLKIN